MYRRDTAWMAICLMLPMLALQGCGTSLGLRLMSDPVARVDSALDEGDYDEAWRIVTRIPQSNPDYQATVAASDRVNEAITRFEQQRIREAEELSSRGDWLSAISLLEESQRHWSHGDALRQARNALDQQQMSPLLKLRSELLISEADWLVSQRQQRRDLARFADPAAQQRASQLDQRQQDVAEEMQVLGDWFASQGNWQQAHRILSATRRLAPELSLPQLERASREVAGAQRRARDARSARLQAQAREYLERYRQSQALDDLLSIGDFLGQQGLDLTAEREEFEVLREERFNRDLQRGDLLYARGDYQQAHDLWQSLVPLAPQNQELAGRIERTRRVLQNLQKLESGS